jgi:porin
MPRTAAIFILRNIMGALFLVLGVANVQARADDVSAVDESWRVRLEQRGIAISMEWDSDVFANARGGSKQGAVTDGLVKLGLDIDCQRISGLGFLADTAIHVAGYYPYGTDISTYVGDLAGVNDNAAYNSPRLYELWLQRGFHSESFNCTLRIGLMGADEEFAVNNTASAFINSSFGAPVALGGTAPVPVYPFSALGTRFDCSVGDDKDLRLTFRSGVFDGNSAAPKFGASSVGAPESFSYNKYGIDFHLNPSTGLIFLNEIVFDFLNRELPGIPPPGPPRWFFGPGHFLVGGFYATNRFENIYQERLQSLGVHSAANPLPTKSGDYGVYALWEQKIYEIAPNSPNGLYLFTRGMAVPEDRNFVSISAETGALYKGLFRRRKDLQDSLGLGFACNSTSDAVRQADNTARSKGFPGIQNLQIESVAEATYVLPITRNWQLQPDLQWVIQPGAVRNARNALVFSVRSILTF